MLHRDEKNAEADEAQQGETPYYSDFPGVPDFGAFFGCSDKGKRLSQGDTPYYEYQLDETMLSDLTKKYAVALEDSEFHWVSINLANGFLSFRNPKHPDFYVNVQMSSKIVLRIIKVDTPETKPVSALRNYPEGPGNVPDFAAAVGWSLQERIDAPTTTQYSYTGDAEGLDAHYFVWCDQLLNAGFRYANKTSNGLDQWVNADETWVVQEGPLSDGRYIVGIVPVVK